jgi:hypothetical protein
MLETRFNYKIKAIFIKFLRVFFLCVVNKIKKIIINDLNISIVKFPGGTKLVY